MAEVFVRIIKNDLPKQKRKTTDKLDSFLQILSQNGVEIVKQSMADSPATGRRYGSHTASSPGNPPRIDTENLVNSIQRAKIRKHRYHIFTDVDYGLVLEFGGAEVLPRPFMGPMAMSLNGTIFHVFNNFLE